MAKREGWRVTDDMLLGTFAFSKMPMWKDLERMRVEGVDHALVRQLAGGEDASSPADLATTDLPDANFLKGGGLDDLLRVRDQYAVLPADFSQLRAIEMARGGAHLVIHGPPGTGKSQTIANIIATLLADGKRVLFVSEKTAALDVVKRRLEECDLDIFCLDLHSERGKKSSVYDQLRESLTRPRSSDTRQFPFEELESKREYLNRVVRALHRTREPLGRTIFQIHGKFAELLGQLRDIPPVDFIVPKIDELDQESLAAIIEPCDRIARRQDEFETHTTNRWMSLTERQPSIQLSDAIRTDMDTVRQAIGTTREKVSPHSEWLDLSPPASGEQALHLVDLIDHLRNGEGIPNHWLDPDILPRLRRMARLQREQQKIRGELIQRLTSAFGENHALINYRAISSAVRLPQADQTALREFLGATWATPVASPTAQLVRNADAVMRSTGDMLRGFTALMDDRCEVTLETWHDLWLAMGNAERIAQLAPLPIKWTEVRGLAQVQRELERARNHLTKLVAAESSLHERFSDQVVDVVDDEMLVRYRADYQSFWKRLRRRFREDQRLLRGHLKVTGKLTVTAAIEGIELALDVRRLRAEWADKAETLALFFGNRFDERQTDWQAIEHDIQQVELLYDAWLGEREVLVALLADVEVSGRLRTALEAAEVSKNQCWQGLKALGREELMRDDQSVRIVLERVNHATGPLAVLEAVTQELRDYYQKPIKNLQELTSLLDDGVRLGEIEAEAVELGPALSADFGDRFDGNATDWDKIDPALDWTEELLKLLPDRLSPAVRKHAAHPAPPAEYEAAADSVRSAVEGLSQDLASIEGRIDPGATPWGSWHSAPFHELENWADDLSAHAESAADWIEYQSAVRDLNQKLGANVVSQIRSVTDRARLVGQIVQRRILGAWLDSQYAAYGLRSFAARDHNAIRRQFEELDRDLPKAARARVRERCFSKYPSRETTVLRAGQLGILRGELSKRRRQFSVRKLFGAIPQILQALKPAFMMSPLAVSKLLSREELAGQRIEFDAVIFDEASQVFPEDAVPAIARGKQVIIVGDENQLPPTNFFRRSLRDDDDEDTDDDEDDTTDALEGRESILNVMAGKMLGKNVSEEYLRMHYRSQHDSLIRFSNHYFYEDQLLVFPSPEPAASGSGIRDVYLPEARYDPQAGRINRGEAERTVEEVFHLIRTCPGDESIGVVTLNRPQANCIQDLIDSRRLTERGLDERFGGDRREPFFVKNLENVRGDERDHMILSIGYGPTVGSGQVPNRFGPINREGGERRLNVAVTRARKSMMVVHSLRPTDIRSEQKGARLLRRYLEYVADPVGAFESEVTVDSAAETESPFEQAVLQALVSRGYRVDRQVGVFGYRIDLAVLSEDGSAYDLGIECDGAMYHNTPAARDRDWLRQSVLEGLGWTIHRVWSTSWVRNPGAELEAIEHAVATARAGAPTHVTQTAPVEKSPEASDPPRSRQDTAMPVAGEEQLPPADGPSQLATEERPLLFDEYAVADLEDVPVGPELQYEVHPTLERLIVRVVEIEIPVHIDLVVERIRVRYGLKQSGRIIKERLDRAIRESIKSGKVGWLPRAHGAPAPTRGKFLIGGNSEADIRPRRPTDGETPRKIDHISYHELEAGLLRIAKETFGAERKPLIIETARQFAYKKTGGNIMTRLNKAISNLVADGSLVDLGGMLSPAGP